MDMKIPCNIYESRQTHFVKKKTKMYDLPYTHYSHLFLPKLMEYKKMVPLCSYKTSWHSLNPLPIAQIICDLFEVDAVNEGPMSSF